MTGTEAVQPGRHEGRSRAVRRTWRTDPLTAYRLVSDVVATAEHSTELLEVAWDDRGDDDLPAVGDRFRARNRIGSTQWASTATVVDADPGRRFAFAVGPPQRPTAVWSFDLTGADAGDAQQTTVAYTVVLGSGPSMFDTIRHLEPAAYDAVVEGRLDGFASSMAHLLDALADGEEQRRGRRPAPRAAGPGDRVPGGAAGDAGPDQGRVRPSGVGRAGWPA